MSKHNNVKVILRNYYRLLPTNYLLIRHNNNIISMRFIIEVINLIAIRRVFYFC